MATEPRIAPLTDDDLERDPAAAELLRKCVQDETADNNIYRTILRHPRVFRRWTGFGAVLLYGWIPERDRELMVLRTAHNCACEYEWEHHKELALERDVTVEQIEGVKEGPEWEGWSEWDGNLIQVADDLHFGSRISDKAWEILSQRYDEKLLIEIPFLVGNYHAVAFALNSLGIEYEGKADAEKSR